CTRWKPSRSGIRAVDATEPAHASEGVAGLSIVEARQHFWDPAVNYHPWLRDQPPIPFRYGDYRRVRRQYLPLDYLADPARVSICRRRGGSLRRRPALPASFRTSRSSSTTLAFQRIAAPKASPAGTRQ